MKRQEILERIKHLQDQLDTIDSAINKIVERANTEFKGDILQLSEEELFNIKKLNEERLQFAELSSLKRMLLSKVEKRERRLAYIGLSKKFFDEDNNKLKGEYEELYVELLDNIEKTIKNKMDAGIKGKLFEIYDFLDEKDFQYQIPEKYLDELSTYSSLSGTITQLRILLTKL